MTTATIYASNASYIDQKNPTYVQGGLGTYFATGQFGGTQTNRGMLLFDISSLGVGWTINTVTLKLKVNGNFLGPSHTVNIYRAKRKWAITSGANGPSTRIDCKASWNNYRQDLGQAWTTGGAGDTTNDRDAVAVGSVSVTSSTSGQISITLTPALIKEWIDGTTLNLGLVLIASDESGTTLVRWCGVGDATQANRPQLVVDYTPGAETLLTNLVAYWKMDEASGNLADVSGHAHAMVPTNTPTQTSGIIGSAQNYARASSQYHSCNDSAVKMGNNDWTFCCWVKLTDKSAVNYYTVASNRDSGGGANAGWELFYHTTGLDYYVFQFDGSTPGYSGNPIADVVGPYSPTAGVWAFLAVRNDSVRKIAHNFANNLAPIWWIDHDGNHGLSPFSYPGAMIASTSSLKLGNGNMGLMNGNIDEVGLWNRWLSNAEILSLYNGGSGLQYPFGLNPAMQFRKTLGLRSGSRGVTE